jgi:hypothetical protein
MHTKHAESKQKKFMELALLNRKGGILVLEDELAAGEAG